MNLRSLGEFGLIGRIASQVMKGEGVSCGIGDDAASLEPTPGALQLITSDMLLEGVHFDLAYTRPELLGRKSLAVNLSDMAAMGGRPRWFLLSLGIPDSIHLDFLDSFVKGLLEMGAEYGVTLVGGDTCSSKGGLVVSITLIGEQSPDKVAYRRGARPGDIICVTGTLGDAALGLAELRGGLSSGQAVDRHLDPVPRCGEAMLLAEAGLPTAMIDVSDGLLADLGHILELSAVGARVDTGQIPRSTHFCDVAADFAADPLQLALAGGEDYELLFTVDPERWAEVESCLLGRLQVTVVGEITANRALQVIAADGNPYHPASSGFNHF